MRIQDFSNLNSIKLKRLDTFKEGSFIPGKILKLEGETVLIDIEGIGTIEATTTSELKNYIDKEVTFMIKSKKHDEIQLKPIVDKSIYNNNSMDSNKNYLAETLRKFGIKDDEVSLKFLDSLIKYRVEISQENLYKGTTILDKIEQLINIKEDEIPLYINPSSSNQEKMLNIKNVDIQNIIFTNKTETNMENKSYIDIGDLFNINIEEIDEKFIKTVSFFIKHEIKPSINNIKFFIQLDEQPEVFSKNYEVLKNIVNKEFTKIDKNIMIGNDKEKNLIEESHREYTQNLEKIMDLIKNNAKQIIDHKNFNVENLVDKMRLLKELNNDLVFIYLPLKIKEDIHNSVITFLKKRRKKANSNNDINIFINLNTINLGKIKIICKVSGLNMSIKFENIKDEDLNLFKENEDELKVLVNDIGYEVVSIVYVEESESILDVMIVDSNPLYYFDVKV